MSESGDEKKEYVNGIPYSYSTAWVNNIESELRWRLYWHQQKILQNKVLPGHQVLEIGVGSGFTANYLRSKGVDVITFDIDAGKKPNIVGNIVSHEFENKYDHILAFEVFEHIPFLEFSLVLKKLAQVGKQYLFLSMPRNEKTIVQGAIQLPFMKERSFAVRRLRRKIVSAHHFWEIDHPATPRKKVEKAMQNAGFLIAEHERVFSFEYFTLKSPYTAEM
jgi:cyclopropane fatty-acyl-phospholipid synthase-like methyltransferase